MRIPTYPRGRGTYLQLNHRAKRRKPQWSFVTMLNHLDPYEQSKTKIISARAAKNRVLTDQREKVMRMLLNGNMYLADHQKTESYVPSGKYFDDGL